MSVEAIAIALHHSRAKGAAKLILIGIANHDGDGGAWPAISTLATYGGINERNAHYAIEKLESLGEVRRTINGGGGRQTAEHMRPNLYTFHLKCPPNCDGTKQHRMLCIHCHKQLPNARRHLRFHLTCDRVSRVTPPVAHDTPPLSPVTDEPSLNQSPRVNEDTQVLKRENVAEVAEEDASGDSLRGEHLAEFLLDSSSSDILPRPQISIDVCPKWPLLEAPHAFNKAGECIDCHALAPHLTIGANA